MLWFQLRNGNKVGYLWKRKLEYPYLTIGLSPQSDNRLYFAPGFTDKNKLLAPIAEVNEDWVRNWGGKNGVLYIVRGAEIETSMYNLQSPILNVGSVYRAYGVTNDSEYSDFLNAPQKYVIPDAEWSISPTIRLYATQNGTPSEGYLQSTQIWTRINPDDIVLDAGSKGCWPTAYYELKPIETSIEVIARPLASFTMSDGVAIVTSICNDFSDYMQLYDASSIGRQYPKSTYPYLRGDMKLDVKSQSLGIEETWGTYISFGLKR